MRRFLIAIPAILVLAGCASESTTTAKGGSGAPVDPAKAVTLRLKPSEGDKHTTNMNMVMKVSAQGQSMDVNMKVVSEDEVTKVEDGKITMVSKIVDASVTGTGPLVAGMSGEINKLKGKTITTVLNERGKTLSTEGIDNSGGLAGQNRPIYPEKPIKKGDTWSETIEQNGQKLDAKFKAEGLETMDGKEAMKMVMTIVHPQFGIEFPMTMWVDTATGHVMKTDGKMNASQQGSTIDMTMNMTSK